MPPRRSTSRLSALDRSFALIEAEAQRWAARAERMLAAVATMRSQFDRADTFEADGARPAAGRGRGRGRGAGRRTRRGPGAGAAALGILTDWGRPGRVNELLAEIEKR